MNNRLSIKKNGLSVRPLLVTRRKFLINTGVVLGSLMFPFIPKSSGQSSKKLDIAIIGCGGKGFSDLESSETENIIALCDADERQAVAARKKHPDAKFYLDFREMLNKEKSIDAVIVATPDHTHAVAAVLAMKLDKHVYCQPPLAHTITELRAMVEESRKHKVITQTGDQYSSLPGYRRAIEILQSGILGQITAVHAWTNKPVWPQGLERPAQPMPVTPGLNWDLWLGPAPFRPYHDCYCPFKWRAWVDFGSSTLGDSAWVAFGPVFKGLNLGYPTTIQPELKQEVKESYPHSSILKFEFRIQNQQEPLNLWWYDGGLFKEKAAALPQDILKAIQTKFKELPANGCLVLGANGVLFTPNCDWEQFMIKLNSDNEFTLASDHNALKTINQTLPRNNHNGDPDKKHHLEWISAIKGGPPVFSSFESAAMITESILLGCLALRTGEKIEWDWTATKSKNSPKADSLIHYEYRKGWTL